MVQSLDCTSVDRTGNITRLYECNVDLLDGPADGSGCVPFVIQILEKDTKELSVIDGSLSRLSGERRDQWQASLAYLDSLFRPFPFGRFGKVLEWFQYTATRNRGLRRRSSSEMATWRETEGGEAHKSENRSGVQPNYEGCSGEGQAERDTLLLEICFEEHLIGARNGKGAVRFEIPYIYVKGIWDNALPEFFRRATRRFVLSRAYEANAKAIGFVQAGRPRNQSDIDESIIPASKRKKQKPNVAFLSRFPDYKHFLMMHQLSSSELTNESRVTLKEYYEKCVSRMAIFSEREFWSVVEYNPKTVKSFLGEAPSDLAWDAVPLSESDKLHCEEVLRKIGESHD